ncbi:MAG: two-component system, OmpR family, phosphate regulon sensor histidine kinase PhoR [Frankiales bacterium]|nr:two-component system, OmpR family, phosphate regulon sensor histidine kinase PhoR [Frankiales bacterium]
MEPGVPFSLMGGVELLAVAACTGLAVSALLRRSFPSFLVGVGALILAAVQVRTALQLGFAGSDNLMLARAAGALIVGAGFATGGLGTRLIPASLYGVVVPLAATAGPSLFATGTTLFAAGAVGWSRRDSIGAWMAGGFGLWAVAAFVAISADDGNTAPTTVLVLRGLGALAILVALGIQAQNSLLSKVVGAILVGVLAMAVSAVAVVGNVVVSSYDKQNRETVESAANSRINSLTQVFQQNANYALLVSQVCADRPVASCQGFLDTDLKNTRGDFVVRVRPGGKVESFGGRLPLTRSETLTLGTNSTVLTVLKGSGAERVDTLYGAARLTGAPPSVAAIAVAVSPNAKRPTGASPPPEVWVYGLRLDDDYVARDFDAGGFGLSVLTGDPLRVVATNRSARQSQQLLDIVRGAGADHGIPVAGRTLSSEGTNPTIRLMQLKGADATPVGLLAISRDAGPALQTERDALRLLMATALLALVLVAGAAGILGRRTVEPVRQLTEAAERVAAGDLSVTTSLAGRDEVGTLSRTFDTMTHSLGQLTGDLRESAARLETVLASMSDGLLATDHEGVVTSVNRAALEMLALEEPDVLGESLSLVADVRDSNGRQLANPALRLVGEPADVYRLDGTRVPVRVEISSLIGVEGVVLVLRDTTREREVERMKTEFLSNVSHELRTPLTPIRGYAEMLVSRPDLEKTKVTEFATTIRDESLKMNRVVDLLVDVATFEAGRVSVTPRELSVKELLDARVTIWQKKAPKRKADFKRRVAAGLPHVLVDPVWVGKALDEFLDNAVKYSPPGTPITLLGSMSPDGTRVRVAVKDIGPGISEIDQVALFTSFEQVDGSATRRVGGLGLGLSFVRRLAEDAGFPLTVTTRVGKGAEFALDLPVASAPKKRR